MKNTTQLVLTVLSFIFAGFLAQAEEASAPVPQLKAGDIERFIDTMPKMVKELQKLGASYENIQDPSAAQAMMANEKVQAILKKYKWDQHEYTRKLTAIAGGYAMVRMEAELANLPEQQRAMMKSMMGAQMAQMFVVHESDIALVRKHVDALTKFFDEQ
ncbi:MAG: hypothetical protein SynsKO_21090 [Synoicihabitans sp.]